jgi:hypothetical protein
MNKIDKESKIYQTIDFQKLTEIEEVFTPKIQNFQNYHFG